MSKEQYLNVYLYSWKFCGGPSLEENGSSDAKDDPLPPKPDKGIDWTVDIAVAVKGLIPRDVRYVTPSKAPPCSPITWNITVITLDRRVSSAEFVPMDRKLRVSISLVKQRCTQKWKKETQPSKHPCRYHSANVQCNYSMVWSYESTACFQRHQHDETREV